MAFELMKAFVRIVIDKSDLDKGLRAARKDTQAAAQAISADFAKKAKLEIPNGAGPAIARIATEVAVLPRSFDAADASAKKFHRSLSLNNAVSIGSISALRKSVLQIGTAGFAVAAVIGTIKKFAELTGVNHEVLTKYLDDKEKQIRDVGAAAHEAHGAFSKLFLDAVAFNGAEIKGDIRAISSDLQYGAARSRTTRESEIGGLRRVQERGFSPISLSTAELRAIGEAADVAGRLGSAGISAFDKQIAKFAVDAHDMAQRADEALPRLREMAAAAQAGKSFGISTESVNDRKAATLATIALIEAESQRVVQLQIQHAQLTGNVKLERQLTEELERRRNRAALIDVGGAPGAIDELRNQQEEADKVAAAIARTAQAIATLQERSGLHQMQTDIARSRGDFAAVADLLTKAANDQKALINETKQGSPIAAEMKRALEEQLRIQLDLNSAESIGRSMSALQMQIETERLRGHTEEVIRLTGMYNALATAKSKFEHTTPQERSALASLQIAQASSVESTRTISAARDILRIQNDITATKARAHLNVMKDLQDEAREEYRLKLNELALTDRTEEQKRDLRIRYAEQLQLQLLDIEEEHAEGLIAIWRRVVKEYGSEAMRIESLNRELIGDLENALGDGFFNAIKGNTDGVREAFRSMLASMLQDITRFMAKQAVIALFKMFMGARYGTGSSWNTNMLNASSMWGSGWAKGGIVPGGLGSVRGFADGGIVKAGNPLVGIVGEGRYNEAVVPLPDGKSIPVSMNGGAGSRVHETHLTVQLTHDFLASMRPFMQPTEGELVMAVGSNIFRNGQLRQIIRTIR